MKTQFNKFRKSAVAILIFALSISSCSKDDNVTEVPKQYFVKKIVTSASSLLGPNQTIDFVYNNQNFISSYKLSTPNGYSNENTIVYNSENRVSKITSITIEKNTITDNRVFNYSYNQGKLSAIEATLFSSTSPININFNYDSAQNKYFGVYAGNPFINFTLDSNNNIKNLVYDGNNTTINYNANVGLFSNASNAFELIFPTILISIESKFIAQFFSTKEIISLDINSNLITSATTKDENNLISNVVYANSTGTVFSINTSYELRNLN